MPATVTLTITDGPLEGESFQFDERTTCIMGRGKDCRPKLPNDAEHQSVSRNHCLLDINPPDIRIRDFGSLNGTIVNGTVIGRRKATESRSTGARKAFREHDLKDGDQIELGETILRVDVFLPTTCVSCSNEIPEDVKHECERAPNLFICGQCRSQVESEASQLTVQPKVCAKCQRDVTNEIDSARGGEFLCSACQSDPLAIVDMLLDQAKSGREDVVGIKGYKVIKELGKGGMGAVYLVEHEETGDRLALKVMLPKVAANERSKNLFLREINNTAALKHRNIVQLHDYGCSNGTFYFTLEFCERGSVADLIKKRGGTLPVKTAIQITLHALSGLHYAHQAEVEVELADGTTSKEQGLVHRDLSPHNILIAKSGKSWRAKIADFGLSKAFDSAGLSGQTYTDSTAGKPIYMPRQQVREFKFSKPEVDVWATAACLYKMLTGCVPREFPKGQDPWYTVLQTDAVPILERNDSIPKRLAKVIDNALIDKPLIRFRSVSQFRSALEESIK